MRVRSRSPSRISTRVTYTGGSCRIISISSVDNIYWMSTEYNEVQYPAAPGHDWDNWKYDIHLAVPHINHLSHTTCFIPPQLLTSSQSAPHTLSCEAKLKYWINWSDQSDRSKCQKLKWIVMYSNNSVDMLTRMTTKESTATATAMGTTTAQPQPPSSQHQQLYQL